MVSVQDNPQTAQWHALDAFCRSHRRLAYYWAQEILTEADLVDEAVQDAFLKAARYIQTYEISRPIEPWMRKIVRQAALSVKAASARQESIHVALQDGDGRVSLTAADVAEQVLHDMEVETRVREITEALETLLPGQRWLIAVEYHNLPRPIIASKLGIGNRALNCRLYRARKAVREQIGVLEGHDQ
jgi:RNA polymerase sigma factor (sigma-70 family)